MIRQIGAPEYPKTKFHPILDPKVVLNAEQESKLDSDWSDHYIHKGFPKWKYHPSKDAVIVKDEQGEKALGTGWFDIKADALAEKDRMLTVVGEHHAAFLRFKGVEIKTPKEAEKFVASLTPGQKISFMSEAAAWTPEGEDWKMALE